MPIVQLSAQFALTAHCPPGRKKVDFWDTNELANKIVAVLRHPTHEGRYHLARGKLRDDPIKQGPQQASIWAGIVGCKNPAPRFSAQFVVLGPGEDGSHRTHCKHVVE